MVKNTFYYLISAFISINVVHSENLSTLLESDVLQSAHVGWQVRAVDTKKPLISYQENKSFSSASTMKLNTVIHALNKAIPNEKATQFYLKKDQKKNDQLIIVASGSCSFGSQFSDLNADKLLAKVVCSLKGKDLQKLDIYFVGEEDELQPVPRGYLWEDVGNYYGAPAGGFYWRDNMYTLNFQSKGVGDTAVILNTIPTLKNMSFKSRVVGNYKNRDEAYIFGSYLSEQRIVCGKIPPWRNSFEVKGSLGNPKAQFLFELYNAIVSLGIKVNTVSSIKKAELKSAMPLCSVEAIPNDKLYKLLLQKSNNLFAEAVFNRTYKGEKEELEIPGVVIKDGSGLSPLNKLTPSYLTQLLCEAQTKHAFVKYLPQCGKEGTVKHFLKDVKFNAYLKSGSMSGVRCYAGYLQHNGTLYAISLFINGYHGSPGESVDAAQQIIKYLYSDLLSKNE